MSNWTPTTWGNLVSLEYGKALRNWSDSGGDVPVYGTNGMIGYTDKALCPYPSVVIGRKGAYRGVHYSDKPFWVIDTGFYLAPKVELDLSWAYYALLTYDINGMDSGSAIPSTSREAFYALPVLMPPPAEQRAIAAILGALDDKIALNRQMNATLEGMARALFQSWFVDFDPVRAKAEGRTPVGMDADTAALFPASFEGSALGPVPKGWGVKPLSEAISVNPPRRLPAGTAAPYLAMENMPTSSARALDWIDREAGSGARFVSGDVLFARITPCLENGKTAYVDFLESGDVGWGSTEYIVFRSQSPLPTEYAYFLARTDDLRSYAIRNMSGTSGRQRVNASAFDHYPVCVPSPEIAVRFGGFARDVFARMKAADEESRTLAETRDALLPKLVSGDLRVGA